MEYLRASGPGFAQEGAGGRGEGGGTGGATQSVRGNYKSFKGTNLTVVEEKHQFIMYTGSAGVPACRAGQHFELFDSILGRVKKSYHINHSLHVQHVR